jgi:broad specificity phosphatase PhoE
MTQSGCALSETKTVYIFRHGETDWNKEGRVQGHTDIPLNAHGREQAKRLQDFFRKHPVEVFLSSDLMRAFETAKIASNGKIKIVTDRRLRETSLGKAEGLTKEEIIAKFGLSAWEAWHSVQPEGWDARFPEGESKREHLARLILALEEYLNSCSEKAIGVASHGGAMRRVLHHLNPDLTDAVPIGNGVVYAMTYHPVSHKWSVNLTPMHV